MFVQDKVQSESSICVFMCTVQSETAIGVYTVDSAE